jgi:hypothetical protein
LWIKWGPTVDSLCFCQRCGEEREINKFEKRDEQATKLLNSHLKDEVDLKDKCERFRAERDNYQRSFVIMESNHTKIIKLFENHILKEENNGR